MKKLLLLCMMCLILTSCTYEEGALGAVVDIEDGTRADTVSNTEDGTVSDTAAAPKDSTEPVLTAAPESSTEPVLTSIPETGTGPAIDTLPELTAVPQLTTEPEPADEPHESETLPADTGNAFTFTVPDQKPADNKTGDPVPLKGKDLKIDLSKYSKDAKLLTADDIWLMSFHCGYISDNSPYKLIIETEQQLDCAMKQYALLPDEAIREKYPISDYSYVIEYVEVGSGGYDLKAGALAVDTDRLAFVQSEDSRTPDPFSTQTTVMDGFCYMAALPKGTLMNEHYENWTYPESQAYKKETGKNDIAVDKETGLQYVKNQLLISAFIGTEKSRIEDIVKEIDAEIVGMIELTGDYQIEFREEKTLNELSKIADRINSYPFISNVTLNLVSELSVQ